MRSGGVSADKITSVKTMLSRKWWRTFGRPWHHLRWFAMRLTAHGVSACTRERNWSAHEWIHNHNRNRLSVTRAETLVRSFLNINLLSRHAMYESGFVEWDVEMLLDENEEDEPAREPPRSSERMAERARRAEGGPAPRSLALAGRVLSLEGLTNLPHPLRLLESGAGARSRRLRHGRWQRRRQRSCACPSRSGTHADRACQGAQAQWRTTQGQGLNDTHRGSLLAHLLGFAIAYVLIMNQCPLNSYMY